MIARPSPLHVLPLLVLPLLGGCVAESGRIPSLAQRAAETHGFEEPAAPPAAVASPDPRLDARIDVVALVTGEVSLPSDVLARGRALVREIDSSARERPSPAPPVVPPDPLSR